MGSLTDVFDTDSEQQTVSVSNKMMTEYLQRKLQVTFILTVSCAKNVHLSQSYRTIVPWCRC